MDEVEDNQYLHKLKKHLLKTGFPVELEVNNILLEKGWSTFPGSYYVDQDTHKNREIDNIAFFPDFSKTFDSFKPLGVSVRLLVECKKLDGMSAVVLKLPQKAIIDKDFDGQLYDFPYLIEKRQGIPLKEFHLGFFLNDVDFHFKSFANRVGKGEGIKPGAKEKKDDSKDLVYEGILQLVKAQISDVKTSMTRDKTITNPYYPFYFSFLVLVIDGPVVEVEAIPGDLRLVEVDHALVKTHYKPDFSDEMHSFLIDIVR